MTVLPAGTPPRSLVVWVPDWPIVATTRDGDDPLDAAEPIAVFEKGTVVACSAAARAAGVRRRMRRRDAQARCPQLAVVDADAVRDHRAFAPLIAAIEEVAPNVQVMQPGLCALRARGPARYFGGEAAAATVLAGAIAALGIDDVRVGIADGTFTAEQAARSGTRREDPVRIVPAGTAADFLAPLPVVVLDEELASLFGRLGVQTVGEVAALGADRLVERFGTRGQWLYALSSGRDPRPVTARTPPPELHREVAFEPPVETADQIAFALRVPAAEFVSRLGAQGLVCTELRVVLTGDRGERSERVWLHPGAFDEAAVVDRVRWQLAEQSPGGGKNGALPNHLPGQLRSAVGRVRIEPEAVDAAAHHTARLFGSGPEERVHRALSRVQAMLGHQGVLTPAVGGGRWLSERQRLVPWGDVAGDLQAGERPWPGSLPDPLPSAVFAEGVPVGVLDDDGDMIAVDARGEPTAMPTVIELGGRRRGILTWAGPWPVIEREWDPARARRAHRFQMVDDAQGAWLLVCEEGVWQIEGRYD
ncbi:DNA polymerase IV [Microbacterium laevaniformans]|uniref:DNA polymerase IV n=1 Tax=Microbacterium laevaniformans TaxID=36807 RepID=A0A150HGQ6_9MICO|nr:DNA polymerase Y family protein [Microbacterium laevaniformans]KXZ61104.1 DNA polymerase IV [Microbacterium laevaniformans]